MRRCMDWLVRGVDGLTQAVAISVGLAVLSMVAIIVYGVVAREVFHRSDIWVTATTTYIMAYITFVGSCTLAWRNRHLRVDVLSHFAGARLGRPLDAATTAIATVAALVMAWLSASFWHDAWATGEQDWGMFSIQLWIPYLSLLVGTILLAAILALRTLLLVLPPAWGGQAGGADAQAEEQPR